MMKRVILIFSLLFGLNLSLISPTHAVNPIIAIEGVGLGLNILKDFQDKNDDKVILNKINSISISRNIDKKSLIINFINFLIKKNKKYLNIEFLNFVENLLHSEIYNDDYFTRYFTIKFSKLKI